MSICNNVIMKLKDTIGYCGLPCVICPSHTGTIADLARDLRQILRKTRFGNFANIISVIQKDQPFKDYDTCYKTLGEMVDFRCRDVCQNGGGIAFCKIKKCIKAKGIDGCWQCDDYKVCEKLDLIKAIHGIAHIENLNKIKNKGIEKLLEDKPLWFKSP
ncbi:MAG: DUF3795 domain-containing protein [Candidatus Zixiibacteriota bacterium]